MITPVAFYQEPLASGPVLNRILVWTNTTTSGTIAIYKYDSDGNVITSRTYAQIGAANTLMSRIIYSERDDDNFYYSVGDLGTSGRLVKWNASDLTIAGSASITAGSPRIIPVGSSKNFICLSTTSNLQFRDKNTLGSTGSNFNYSTTGSKQFILVSDLSATTTDLIVYPITTGEAMGRFTFSTTSYGINLYTEMQTDANFESGVLIKEDNTFLLAASAYIYNVSDGSQADTSANAGSPILQSGLHRFSNGDILIIESGAIRRRTLANVKANSTTNVWSITLSTIVSGTIDDQDNVYVVLSTTTNGFRKYNSSGTLVWQRTLAANGYGIGIAHK